MSTRKVSAQFAAYTWFAHLHGETPTAQEQAVRYARKNWSAFLPCAHEGLGRLLIRVAGEGQPRDNRQQRQALAH